MNFWYIFLILLGFLIIIFLILALPRKKNERIPSIEALDDLNVAKSFERMSKTPPFKLLRRMVISKVKSLNPKGTLVDIGCGSGNLIVQIAKKFFNLTLIGVDLSDEIISIAQERVNKNRLNEKIKFEVGSVDNLPFPDNSIDFIVSTLSLHHWSNPINSLNEIFRVLKNKNMCLIFDFRRNSRKFFYGLLTFATKVVVPKPLKKINEPLGSLMAAYTANEVTKILSNFPFINFEIRPSLAWMFIKIEKSI